MIMKAKTLRDYLAAGINPKIEIFRNGDVLFNSIGTENDEPIVGDGIWLEYWEVASGCAIPDVCPCCNEPLDRGAGNIHGTHVQTNQSVIATRYIIPTCAVCNGKHGQQLIVNYADEIMGVEAINK